jgi:glutamate synthase domain-containing protein 2
MNKSLTCKTVASTAIGLLIPLLSLAQPSVRISTDGRPGGTGASGHSHNPSGGAERENADVYGNIQAVKDRQ